MGQEYDMEIKRTKVKIDWERMHELPRIHRCLHVLPIHRAYEQYASNRTRVPITIPENVETEESSDESESTNTTSSASHEKLYSRILPWKRRLHITTLFFGTMNFPLVIILGVSVLLSRLGCDISDSTRTGAYIIDAVYDLALINLTLCLYAGLWCGLTMILDACIV